MNTTRSNNHGQTFKMDSKYTKAIDKRTSYSMETVIEWWKRMFMGWIVIEGDKITFNHGRMDNGTATYTRNIW